MNSLPQKNIDLFWGHVDKEKSNTFYNGSRCWEWTAFCVTKRGGYGQFTYCKFGFSKKYPSHRLAYELTYGEIPAGLFVCHHCDNPPCCNPAHLFLGTRQDNIDDMWNKGRGVNFVAHGEDHAGSKLLNTQIIEIREIYSSGKISQAQLAKDYGVSQGLIWQIVSNGYRK